MRASGILLHISSLPSDCGIGTMGKEAYRFIDFLKKSGQQYWQILPVGPTSYGDSPYQSFSTFAGNPYFIDFDKLKEEGLLLEGDYEHYDWGENPESVDYAKIYQSRFRVLKKAYVTGYNLYKKQVQAFREENAYWIEDYALFMALKEKFDQRPWQEWDEDIKLRKPEAVKRYRRELEYEINFWVFIQYLFFKQWNQLRDYAHQNGIQIIGDIPFYVATDSADTWTFSEAFLFDERKNPVLVAGVPPDGFSATGQLWGNPIYDWDYLKKHDFQFWMNRLKGIMKLYDKVRIDHFRGFDSYWVVPYGETTALNGEWRDGPGLDFFEKIKEEIGDVDIIAEDLGYLTPRVRQLLRDTGYPGMKVLEFAFDSREDSVYLPHHYIKHCVVYTGTHDNLPVRAWLEDILPDDRDFAIKYLCLNEKEGYHWGMIRSIFASVSELAIAQMQDFLGLGVESRMNEPSTVGKNWRWRMKKDAISETLSARIHDLTASYFRLPKEDVSEEHAK